MAREKNRHEKTAKIVSDRLNELTSKQVRELTDEEVEVVSGGGEILFIDPNTL